MSLSEVEKKALRDAIVSALQAAMTAGEQPKAPELTSDKPFPVFEEEMAKYKEELAKCQESSQETLATGLANAIYTFVETAMK